MLISKLLYWIRNQSVFDCTSAIILAQQAGFPNETFNLGSQNPPLVYDLLKNLIQQTHSRSNLIKTPAKLVKWVLAGLERLGCSPLYRDQYTIADKDYLVSTNKAQ